MVYKRCDEVLGVRYWRVDYLHVVPRFEVFRVVAHDKHTGKVCLQISQGWNDNDSAKLLSVERPRLPSISLRQRRSK
jgi:hypothetical protein